MSTYGEVVRMVKGRPSEIEAEVAIFRKVDLPSGGVVILANYPAWLSERCGADFAVYTRSTRHCLRPSMLATSSPFHRDPTFPSITLYPLPPKPTFARLHLNTTEYRQSYGRKGSGCRIIPHRRRLPPSHLPSIYNNPDYESDVAEPPYVEDVEDDDDLPAVSEPTCEEMAESAFHFIRNLDGNKEGSSDDEMSQLPVGPPSLRQHLANLTDIELEALYADTFSLYQFVERRWRQWSINDFHDPAFRDYLRITQQLILQPCYRVYDVSRRITVSVSHAIYLCLPETTDAAAIPTSNKATVQNQPLRHFVKHLKKPIRRSLGHRCVPINAYSHKSLLRRAAQSLADETPKEDHLVGSGRGNTNCNPTSHIDPSPRNESHQSRQKPKRFQPRGKVLQKQPFQQKAPFFLLLEVRKWIPSILREVGCWWGI